jgi:hypothetical protein
VRDLETMPDAWKEKLNAVFGTDEWIDIFYTRQS